MSIYGVQSKHIAYAKCLEGDKPYRESLYRIIASGAMTLTDGEPTSGSVSGFLTSLAGRSGAGTEIYRERPHGCSCMQSGGRDGNPV